MGSISLGNSCNLITSKPTFHDITEAFLVEDGNSFHLSRKKLDHPHLKDFLKCEYEQHMKQLLTPPTTQDVYHTSNHRLAIETRRWSTIPVSGDYRLCHVCPYNVVENEAHFVGEYPLYNRIIDKFNHYLRM